MQRAGYWLVPITAIGSVIVTIATLMVYIQAHRAGQPGGYLPMLLGAFSVGLLVTGCNYFIAPRVVRSGLVSISLGSFASLIFLGVLVAALISSFGS